MLHGAAQMLATHGVDYIFISTHSNELHGQCAQLLESQGYHILASANLDETYSVDGVLVARGPHVTQPQLLPISRKPCRQATVPAHGSGDTLNKVEV